ncbi:hypothetical protein V2I01_11730 [Micromonospora sp. BRA006-A]|nr:hypothetical protein [Micromonospora sp. BRA006-A]
MLVSELRFNLADVAGVRFAVSPANETVMSMWALAEPVATRCTCSGSTVPGRRCAAPRWPIGSAR